MFIGAFFALNLFVGVIVDSFERIKKESDESATMTAEQQQWVNTMRTMARTTPQRGTKPPSNPFRHVLYNIVTSSVFDGLLTLIIVLNVLTMACDYWGIEDNQANYARYNNGMALFCYIFYFEFVLKLLALGPNVYFTGKGRRSALLSNARTTYRSQLAAIPSLPPSPHSLLLPSYFIYTDNWCRFDFFLVCLSLLDQFAQELLERILPVPPFLLRVLRIFRILRILRLLKGAKGLRNLIVTLVLSFPSLLNVGSLLCLVLFIYSVLGRSLFAFLAHQEHINEICNFETLASSGLLLFQVR